MINIKDKHNCCGCSACAQKCPKQCISMKEDEEGFLYPNVEQENCIECGLCEQVCPVIHQDEPRQPLKVYAAINPNEEIRIKSSSGGIFSMLAEQTISNGGVVFGARFNDQWEVVHDYTETIEGLEAFRGSKYVQSTIGDNYIKAEQFLKQNRKVLFSGTPCQIAGLRKFLRKEYDNLLLVDIICHGVPSPLIWRDYLNNILSRNNKCINDIKYISFRSKIIGWKRFSMVCRLKDNSYLINQPLNEDIFIRGFLKNIYLRPICHSCISKEGRAYSDISIADYWGISRIIPHMDDDKGTSLVMIHTNKGNMAYSDLSINSMESTYEQAIRFNPAIEKSCVEPKERINFWQLYSSKKTGAIVEILEKLKPNIFERILYFIKRLLKLHMKGKQSI